MATLRYISHPEVLVDPDVPIPEWGLSDLGRARGEAMLAQSWVTQVGRIVSSPEVKARELAGLLGAHLELGVEVRADTGENDRAATGFVPPDQFEQLADQFFAEPERSVRGWERAIDAQSRIVGALADLLHTTAGPAPATGADVAVIGHGGVGTLWLCHLAGLPIDRRHDQPGQGHYFSVDVARGSVLHPWRPIDE